MCTVCWHQKRVLWARERQREGDKGVRSSDFKRLNKLELKMMTSCNSETTLKERRDVYMAPDEADVVLCVCVCVSDRMA